jgi:hypothetical protein
VGLTAVVIAGLAAVQVPAAVGGRPTGDLKAGPAVVIWPDGPVRTPRTLADNLGEQTTVLVCHCLGLTPESAQVAEKKLAMVIAGLYRQVIDGQSVNRFPVQDWAQPLTRDDDVKPPLFDLPVEWRIRTTPA